MAGMKYLKKFNESLRPSDYTIFKIRYYADGINVRKGKFDGDDKQHWNRAQEYTKFFWEMVEKVTGKPLSEWVKEYFSSTSECAREELHEKYDIIIPESEEYYYWYIPNTMGDLIQWVKDNCKLPFQIVRRAPYNSTLDRPKTTWRRDDARKFVLKNLKRFNENISIFNQDWKKFLPETLEIITSNGNWKLHKSDLMINGDLIQFSYYQKTFDKPEDVNNDGEPDYLCFDIYLVKNNKGDSHNPDTLRLNVDITYGDNMSSEFTIEKPNKVNVIHYTGKNSKYDPETKFGFTDESLDKLIEFFNRFGYQLSREDFKFLDKEDDSYHYKDDPKHLYTDTTTNETLSNYTLDNWPNGTYKGTIKGYEVYSDEVDSGFRATTGYRNAFPIPCTIYVKDGTAIAFSKGGVLFSDGETQKRWKEEFGSLENDPRMKNYI